MKKRILRRCLAEEIGDETLGRVRTGGPVQTDPEDGVPTYDAQGVEVD